MLKCVGKCKEVGLQVSEHRLDPKGRIVLPAKLREKLGDLVFVAAGMDGCVALYSENAWNDFMEKLKKLPFYSQEKARDFMRVMGDGEDISVDGTGRVLLPARLREYAQLGQDVVFIRLPTHVEIWDKERWEKKQQTALSGLSDLAKELGI